jgi:hypothetical protein
LERARAAAIARAEFFSARDATFCPPREKKRSAIATRAVPIV